jgi:hypothetical protein
VLVSARMLISVNLRGFFSVMGSMKMVPMSYVSMMGCFLMIAALMVLGCFSMVLGSDFQMLGSLVMMFNAFCHGVSPIVMYKTKPDFRSSHKVASRLL